MHNKKYLLTGLVVALLAGTSPTMLRAATNPKGYVVAEITVADPDAYKQYAAAVPAILAQYGGKYLVRGGKTAVVEGEPPSDRVVVIEFDSLAAAQRFEDSKEYAAIAEIRRKAARSRVFLVEGVPQ